MSPNPVDPDIVAAIKEITYRYIGDRESTPAHILKTQLGKKRHLLGKAVQDGYLLNLGPTYLPGYPALEFVDRSTRESAAQSTTLVLNAMRAIYERDGDRMCNHDVVLQMCRTLDPSATPENVSIGMLFAKDFRQLVTLWNIPDGEHSLTLSVSDRLLDFDDLPSAWERELEHTAESTSVQEPQPGQLDVLLPIFNRSQFDADYAEFTASANEAAPLALVMVDVDHFKEVNDTSGHAAGDEVLKATASAMKAVCQLKGRCYRWGGDELAVLLPNHTIHEARAVAERIQETVSHLELEKHSERITVSIGLASFPGSCSSSEELFQRSDDALLHAKEAGRDRICCAGGETVSTSAPSAPGARLGATSSSETLRQQVAALQQQIEALEQERIEAEHFTLGMQLQQAVAGNYILNVRNDTDKDVTVETVQFFRGDAPLTDPNKPKPTDDWRIPARSGKSLSWSPQPDPVSTLMYSEPNLPRGVATPVRVVMVCQRNGKPRVAGRTLLVTVDYLNHTLTQYGP